MQTTYCIAPYKLDLAYLKFIFAFAYFQCLFFLLFNSDIKNVALIMRTLYSYILHVL